MTNPQWPRAKRRGRAVRHVLTAATTALPCLAGATTLTVPSVEALVGRATAIVVGRPDTDQAVSSWDAGHRLIYTRTPVRVRETWAGTIAPGSEVLVDTVGGFIASENVGMAVPGAPIFSPSEEVVLFLGGAAPQVPRPVGLSAGKFEVSGSGADATVTRRDMAGANVVGTEPGTPTTLGELRALVDAALKARQQGGRP